MRRATYIVVQSIFATPISIHALREEGDEPTNTKKRKEKDISIHALREEGDADKAKAAEAARKFLSTPSVRRATKLRYFVAGEYGISIHALREEGDGGKKEKKMDWSISIHALREEGDVPQDTVRTEEIVISIHALREEGDRQYVGLYPPHYISIHALREEGDSVSCSRIFATTPFLSTPSVRRATYGAGLYAGRGQYFYPRPP